MAAQECSEGKLRGVKTELAFFRVVGAVCGVRARLIAGLFAVWRVELGCYGSFGNVVVVQGWMLAWGGKVRGWVLPESIQAQEAPNHAPYIKAIGLPIAVGFLSG
jgi:hypothetical protein